MSSSSVGSSGRRGSLKFQQLTWTNIHREFLPDLLKKDGDFLLRRGSGGGGSRVLSVNSGKKIHHFKFDTGDRAFAIESRTFATLEALVSHYYDTQQTLNTRMNTKLITPVYNNFEMIPHSKLTFKEQLGKGNFGEVWKALLAPDDEPVAIKILSGSASEKDRAECMAEAKLMSILQHENVVVLKGLSFWSQNPSDLPRLLIVLEFCNFGSLDKLLEKGLVEERGKLRALLDSAKGIEYLHKRDIIHRDIASRNCLVNKTPKKFVVKIADFGLSRLAPEHYELVTKRRLPIFSTAPDALQHREWTSASDVYSFGVLMLEVYNKGVNPYEAHFLAQNSKLNDVITTLRSGFRLPLPKSMPGPIGELCQRCMHGSSQQRPTMSDVVDAIRQYHSTSSDRPTPPRM